MKQAPLFALAAALVSGCGSLTPFGLLSVASFSPLDVDTSTLRAAVALPSDWELKTGDLRLGLTFTPSDGSKPISETVSLVVSSRIAPRQPEVSEDEAFFIARLTPADADRFRSTQFDIRKRREAVGGKGSFVVTVNGGCYSTQHMPAKLPLRTFVSPNNEPFVEISRHADLFADLGPAAAEQLRSKLHPCPVRLFNR
ncbi:MAG: hypothetical protein AAFR60_01340 [Pseudomonadota bacterium]